MREIVARTVRVEQVTIDPVLSGPEILEIRDLALGCPVAEHIIDYAIALVEGTHGSLEPARRYLRAGASPRAVQALIIGAKMRAIFDGRVNASIEDVRHLAPPVLRHRVLLNFDAEADGVAPEQVLEQLIAEVDSKAR